MQNDHTFVWSKNIFTKINDYRIPINISDLLNLARQKSRALVDAFLLVFTRNMKMIHVLFRKNTIARYLIRFESENIFIPYLR